MRVYLPRLGLAGGRALERLDAPVATVERLAALDRQGLHRLVDEPEGAEVVLFTQCHMLPTDWRLRAVRDHAVTERFPERVMVYDERDRPWCGFPGVYVSMPSSSFQARWQRPWAYLPAAAATGPHEPDLLFSFIGSASARCRRPLFDLEHPAAVVEEVRGFTFFDPSSEDFERRRRFFKEVLQRSRFVLCPRGRGTSSIRLYETLAAGRVPVVISDHWMPPPGPDWEALSIRWPEGTTEGLVEMLEERAADWPAMSSAARAAHAAFFSPEVWFHRVIELCLDLEDATRARPFPRGGLRNRAFLAVGLDVARWRSSTAVRHAGRRVLERTRPPSRS
jgi:hypothetical protein